MPYDDASVVAAAGEFERLLTRAAQREEADDLQGALEDYSQAILLNTSSVEAWQAKAMVLGQLKDYAGAVMSYEGAMRHDTSDPELRIEHGTALMLLEQPGLALKSFSQAVQLGSDTCPGAWRARANAHFYLGSYREAVADYEKLAQLRQQDDASLKYLALSLQRQHWQAQASTASTTTPLQPYGSVTIPPVDGVPPNPLHSLHCAHWLDADTCARLISSVEGHTAQVGWTDSRHRNFSTVDIELSNVPSLREWIAPRLHSVLVPSLAALFEVPIDALQVQEVFLVKYSETGQDSLELHRDAHLLSFNILLSDPASFDGGGTLVQALGGALQVEQRGDVLLHCGQMMHGGARVTRGTRYIIVGFVRVLGAFVRKRRTADTVTTDPGCPEDYAELEYYWSSIQEHASGNWARYKVDAHSNDGTWCRSAPDRR